MSRKPEEVLPGRARRVTRLTRPRAARYPFVANVILTDLESGRKTEESVRNLSLYGCHVVPGTRMAAGARVRVQIVYQGEHFEANGRVTDIRGIKGVGIAFTKIEARYESILDKWISALRDKKNPAGLAE